MEKARSAAGERAAAGCIHANGRVSERKQRGRACWERGNRWRAISTISIRRCCPGRRSEAFPLGRELLGTRNLHALLAEGLFLSGEEVGESRGGNGGWREEARNHAFALGDVDFLAVAEKILDGREAIAQIADGGFLHVMHFSITKRITEQRKSQKPQAQSRRPGHPASALKSNFATCLRPPGGGWAALSPRPFPSPSLKAFRPDAKDRFLRYGFPFCSFSAASMILRNSATAGTSGERSPFLAI